MAEIGKSENKSQQKTPQQQLETLWKERLFWNEGPSITLTQPLPESMRVVQADTDFLVLRSPLPGAPVDEKTGKLKDVPIAVFGPNAEPKYIEDEAIKLGKNIQDGEVWYVPPQEIIME